MFPALFSWFWAALSLSAAILAWKRLRPVMRTLVCAGAVLNGLAGAANGLVITANGFKMPVESVPLDAWDEAPAFLCEKGDEDGLACAALSFPLVVLDRLRPDDIHHHVGEGESPALAWLDDRNPLRFCERSTVYSIGDALAAFGWFILAIAGSLWALLGLIRRKTPPDASA
jgi:hypothetical protein